MSNVVHIVEPAEAVRIGRFIRARCGIQVDRRHGLNQEPTCAECLRLEAEDARAVETLREDERRFA